MSSRSTIACVFALLLSACGGSTTGEKATGEKQQPPASAAANTQKTAPAPSAAQPAAVAGKPATGATGPKVIEIAARHADRICFAVGADTERLGESIAHARRAAEAGDRDPGALRFGAYLNCVIHPDREAAREAIRGGLSVFAHFSGFRGMDIESLPEGTRAAARHLRSHYDMTQHGKTAGDHAQAPQAVPARHADPSSPAPDQ